MACRGCDEIGHQVMNVRAASTRIAPTPYLDPLFRTRLRGVAGHAHPLAGSGIFDVPSLANCLAHTVGSFCSSSHAATSSGLNRMNRPTLDALGPRPVTRHL